MGQETILIVDDEKEIRDLVGIYLRNEGYEVILAGTGLEALKVIGEQEVDLIVLDVMMPEVNGIDACMEIRKNSNVPIIMLSAKTEDIDKIMGLSVGADDYLAKPFNPLELIARVNSQIRRYTRFSPLKENNDVIKIGAIELNKRSKVVLRDGEIAKLTPLEFKILSLLMDNPGRVFSIEEIYERVWNEVAFNVDTVTVHIRRIREKIEINPKEPRYLKVVWGIGYKFEKDHRG